MQYKKIIPCLDIREGRVVKGVHFVNLRDAADPVEAGALYSREGADEIAFLDIMATVQGRKTMIDLVKRTVQAISVPLIVGGGISELGDISKLINAGASKVSINTAAVKNPEFVRQAANEFGRSAIIVAVDAQKTHRTTSGYEVFINGGRTPTGMDVINWVKQAVEFGAAELLPTSIDADGTKEGYDLELTRKIAEAVSIPVIASGGAGKMEHLYQALTEGKANAVLAASIFHFRELTIGDVKRYLKEKGVPVRLETG
jgi:cyclase